MAKIIGLPKLSPTMDEGTLVKWVKQEGESIEVDDLLAEVETDKATMEFRSFDKGVLLKRLVEEGVTLAPDTPVAIIGKKGEDVSGLVGSSAKSDVAAVASPPESAPTPAAVEATAAPLQVTSSNGRVLASPVVRKIAREQDLDLNQVKGSGPGGRIVKRDVEGVPAGSAAGARGQAASFQTSAATSSSNQTPRVEKLTSMRKTIARRLSESKQQIPHFYLTVDIDADSIWQTRLDINEKLKAQGEKVSVNDFIIKGVASALAACPEANASFAGDSIHFHQRVDISVAVAIPDGLVTPVVRDADLKGVLAISREVKDLAKRAKDKKLSLEEMTNGTFSISNLGMYGIDSFSAVINPPEGAILAVGGVRQEPVVKNGQVIPGRKMRMTLSCDHRVIDGAVGAQFLKELTLRLEQPVTMLL